MEPTHDSSVRWREEAERARAIGAQMTDPEPRRIMAEIAEAYELLALHALKWTTETDGKGSTERP